ncbi:methylation-associated defense system AAA family ATPase MAD3 [Vibrio lentus]|uniref:methylation-associated defense system AAA family ATPase MAD3 n=1 Tax=Vibrio lentus TaxID=136468 RepID=UPI000C81DB92|nr:AAA family ATPase [Vibrio lentus]PMH08664.1 hypothetical protein BCU76_04790 [Vibrio lentus]
MISRIEAYRYRCFQKLNIELDQFHVFAGSNGSGKTTLLDIPALLGDMVRVTNINEAFFTCVNGRARSRAENPIELVHKLRGEGFTLALEVDLPDSIKDLLVRNASNQWLNKFENPEKRPGVIRYELALKILNDKLVVSEEHLYIFPKNKFRPEPGMGLITESMTFRKPCFEVISRSWGENSVYTEEFRSGSGAELSFGLRESQLALASLPADHKLYPAALWFQQYLLESAFSYEPQWTAMRVAASPRDKLCFKPDGSSLAWQVLHLQENNLKGFATWLELVNMTLPNVINVEARKRDDDGYCYLVATYKNEMQVPSTSLSHGTLHILALTIIPFVENAPNMLTLEEPENGVHPKAIHAILETLGLTQKTQLWMSTHSPTVLANTELSNIITMRINSYGETEVLRGSEHPRLKNWKNDIDLGTLFAAGVFE